MLFRSRRPFSGGLLKNSSISSSSVCARPAGVGDCVFAGHGDNLGLESALLVAQLLFRSRSGVGASMSMVMLPMLCFLDA